MKYICLATSILKRCVLCYAINLHCLQLAIKIVLRFYFGQMDFLCACLVPVREGVLVLGW